MLIGLKMGCKNDLYTYYDSFPNLLSAESDKMDHGNSCSNSSQSKKYLAKPESASKNPNVA